MSILTLEEKTILVDSDLLYIEDISEANLSKKPKKIRLSIFKSMYTGGSIGGNEDEVQYASGGSLSGSDNLLFDGTNTMFLGRLWNLSGGVDPSGELFRSTKETITGAQNWTLHTLSSGQACIIDTVGLLRKADASQLYVSVKRASFDRFGTARMHTDSSIYTAASGTFAHSISTNDILFTITPPDGTSWEAQVISLIITGHA